MFFLCSFQKEWFIREESVTSMWYNPVMDVMRIRVKNDSTPFSLGDTLIVVGSGNSRARGAAYTIVNISTGGGTLWIDAKF